MLYFIDYENVQKFGFAGHSLLNNKDKVILFYNKNQHISKDIIHSVGSNCEVDAIELVKQGKNGLDFYIGVCVGNYINKYPSEDIAIISRDSGFLAVSDYCKKYLNKEVIIAPDISNAYLTKHMHIENEILYNQNSTNMSTILFKNSCKEKMNTNLCKIAEIKNVNLDLVKIYDSNTTSFGLYNSLIHKYGKKEGLRIYHKLKDAGFKKEDKISN